MLPIVYADCTTDAVSLSKLLQQAQRTVLYFYPKDNTPGCTTEAKEFTDLKEKFEKLNAQVIGVSKDNTDAHCAFIEKHGLGISLISDEDLELHKRFDAWGEKNVFGKKTTGTIRSTIILSQDNKEIHSWHNVRARGHAEKVLSRLKTNLS